MSKAIFRLRNPQELTRRSQESMVTVGTTESWTTTAVQSDFPMSKMPKRPAQLTLAAGESTTGTCSLKATVTAAATRCIFAKVPPSTGRQTHLASLTSSLLETPGKAPPPRHFWTHKMPTIRWAKNWASKQFQHNIGKLILHSSIESKSHVHCKWKKMDDIKVMFVFKHIDQKPFCNDKIH